MKKKAIKVSVVIPAYNVEKYIEKCLDSIMRQSYNNIEIIVIDDGSTDRTGEILDKYALQKSRIKIIHQKNSGGIIARKNGILQATGDYVLIADSDDWLEANLIEKCVSSIEKYNRPDIIKYGYILEPSKRAVNLLGDTTISEEYKDGKELDDIILRLVYTTDCNQIWNEIFKKELFDFNDETYRHIVKKGEDLQINLQLFKKAQNIVLLSDNLYHYIDNPSGITRNLSATKTAKNIKDGIFLNSVREKLANDRLGSFDKKMVANATLTSFAKRMIKIIANNDNPKKDIALIQEVIADEFSDYLGDFKKSDVKHNFFVKIIAFNIINRQYLKNLKYRPLCKLVTKIGLLK